MKLFIALRKKLSSLDNKILIYPNKLEIPISSTNGSIDSNSNTGGYDAIILKYNSSGTKQWSRQFC